MKRGALHAVSCSGVSHPAFDFYASGTVFHLAPNYWVAGATYARGARLPRVEAPRHEARPVGELGDEGDAASKAQRVRGEGRGEGHGRLRRGTPIFLPHATDSRVLVICNRPLDSEADTSFAV